MQKAYLTKEYRRTIHSTAFKINQPNGFTSIFRGAQNAQLAAYPVTFHLIPFATECERIQFQVRDQLCKLGAFHPENF
jgi:hypothetical protein